MASTGRLKPRRQFPQSVTNSPISCFATKFPSSLSRKRYIDDFDPSSSKPLHRTIQLVCGKKRLRNADLGHSPCLTAVAGLHLACHSRTLAIGINVICVRLIKSDYSIDPCYQTRVSSFWRIWTHGFTYCGLAQCHRGLWYILRQCPSLVLGQSLPFQLVSCHGSEIVCSVFHTRGNGRDDIAVDGNCLIVQLR